MCGRYSLFDDQENTEIHRIIAAVKRTYPYQPIRTGEIFPTNIVPVLTMDGADLVPRPLVWGFPKYSGGGVIINARAETAAEKKTFRQSLFADRCAVPSTGFYEWDKQKRKYLFRLPSNQTLYMAGICKNYDGVRKFVILTTAANASMVDVHNRMPIILPEERVHQWVTDTNAALNFLQKEMPELVRL